MTDDGLDAAVTETVQFVSSIGNDTRRFSQAESADFFQAVADECLLRSQTILEEMADG